MDLLSQGLSRSFPNCYTLSDNMPSLLDRPSRQRTLYYETETSISQFGATSARLHWLLPYPQLESPPERPSSNCRKPSRGGKNCNCRETHILRRELDVMTSSFFCSFKVKSKTSDCSSFCIRTCNRQLVELITLSKSFLWGLYHY